MKNIIVVKASVLAEERFRVTDLDGDTHVLSKAEALELRFIAADSPKFYEDGQGKPNTLVLGGVTYLVVFRVAGGRDRAGARVCAHIKDVSTGRKCTAVLRETLNGQYYKFNNYHIHANGWHEELWDESKADVFRLREEMELA